MEKQMSRTEFVEQCKVGDLVAIGHCGSWDAWYEPGKVISIKAKYIDVAKCDKNGESLSEHFHRISLVNGKEIKSPNTCYPSSSLFVCEKSRLDEYLAQQERTNRGLIAIATIEKMFKRVTNNNLGDEDLALLEDTARKVIDSFNGK
jgi:hypothetical protein